ncbi:hypothetical protein PUN28_018733 [Cardiocondyla obscurior]|uniref:Uncharacterized protein n=1 Tax=Cardiocondyla obscurior TaxID=286306 RepID=A0AAW2EHF7_9HYME
MQRRVSDLECGNILQDREKSLCTLYSVSIGQNFWLHIPAYVVVNLINILINCGRDDALPLFPNFRISLSSRSTVQARVISVAPLGIEDRDTNLDLSALDLGVEPVVRGEGDPRDSVTAEHGILVFYLSLPLSFFPLPSFFLFAWSLNVLGISFSLSFPLASPGTHRDYVMVTATKRCVAKKGWTTRRWFLENARLSLSLSLFLFLFLSLSNPAGPPGYAKKKGIGGEGWGGRVVCAISSSSFRMRSESPRSSKEKPAGDGEQGERTGSQVGMDSRSLRYITCVLPAAVLNAQLCATSCSSLAKILEGEILQQRLRR